MRGGVRKGAGRPKKEPTKVVRVPIGCLDYVIEAIELYKQEKLSPTKESRGISKAKNEAGKQDHIYFTPREYANFNRKERRIFDRKRKAGKASIAR